ncbi:MAG TPA: transcriptional repressor LexA [Petrotogaceae bacterium]|nr:transcriptional repressor LexA [Petrotogaceae bacterium]HNV04654.1 transcriptional repressor LexA [Petrotogaceae bacterium]HNY36621.1 transcriptional repressor LexA [Petrotogaceae bacterium]HOG34936.1 transcriptional repressor LexA [Petrotogaceae bacterium]HPA92466.1 transcriptional repressor LexA [Petrotogaceae bacterium]
MKTLTKRQEQILEFIKSYVSKNGYPPTIRDINQNFSMKSPRAAHKHLLVLEKKGYIERNGVSRGIKLTAKSGDIFTKEKLVPIVGKVAAGEAIEAIENVTDFIPLPANFFTESADYFGLRVEGTSMIEAHIVTDDYVIIKKQDSASDGDIVVALIDDNYATLKRFKGGTDMIHLIPENKNMDIIEVEPQRLKIQGKMVGLIRKL